MKHLPEIHHKVLKERDLHAGWGESHALIYGDGMYLPKSFEVLPNLNFMMHLKAPPIRNDKCENSEVPI